MTKDFPSQAHFDAVRADLEAATRAWVEHECNDFDAAVDRAAGRDPEAGSIWDMPAIDSKRVAGLLAELEPIIGCKLPSSLAKSGGYETADELIDDLFEKIRDKCGAGAEEAADPRATKNYEPAPNAIEAYQ